MRDFVFELLTAQDRRLTRSEVLNLDTPDRDGVVELMEEYKGDVERIAELEEKFDRLQEELDGVILREVDGLGDEEEAVIDEFLEVW